MLRTIRLTLAIVFFAIITLLFLDFSGTLHGYMGWMAKIQFLPALLALNVGVVLLLVVLTLLFGRVYCSVICPLGVFQDVISRFAGKRKKNRFRYSPARKWLRYGMLALFFVTLVAGVRFHAVASLLEPYSSYGRIASNLFAPVYQWGNLWSWHIWITDENIYHTIKVTNHQNVSHDLMPIHLGWCEGEVINYAARSCQVQFIAHGQTRLITVNQMRSTTSTQGNCTFYEWGRKDPLRPSSGYAYKNKTWYNAAGIASTANHAVESFPFGNECIKNYIRKPDVMQKEIGGDNTYFNLWNADNNTNSNVYNDNPVTKNVYDPCPVGFAMPPSNTFTGFTTTGENVTNTVAKYNGEWNSSLPGWNFYCGPNKTGGTIFFPMTGERISSGGHLSAVGSLGHTWSATSTHSNYAHNLTLYTNYWVWPLDRFSKSAGHGVRPCLE